MVNNLDKYRREEIAKLKYSVGFQFLLEGIQAEIDTHATYLEEAVHPDEERQQLAEWKAFRKAYWLLKETPDQCHAEAEEATTNPQDLGDFGYTDTFSLAKYHQQGFPTSSDTIDLEEDVS